ncbi:MAG: hypothetical protein OQK72_07665, partial [Gammaproteobacteria bacterium]|nr:hypothetical protein [Gammaproteobacteria bacterium]
MNQSSITEQSWRQRKRAIIDNVARYTIGLGGISVIFAIVLIFFYLLWVVFPIFQSASIELQNQFESSFIADDARYQVIEESGQLALRIQKNGDLVFFSMQTGEEVLTESIDLNGASEIAQVVSIDVEGKRLALMLDDNRLLFLQIAYRVNFVNDQRVLNPLVSFPFGEEAIELKDIDHIRHLKVIRNEERLTLLAIDTDGQLLLQSYEVEDGDELAEPELTSVQDIALNVDFMLVDTAAHWLYLASRDGHLVFYDISDIEAVEQVNQLLLIEPGRQLTKLAMLLGGNSLIASDDQGTVRQW